MKLRSVAIVSLCLICNFLIVVYLENRYEVLEKIGLSEFGLFNRDKHFKQSDEIGEISSSGCDVSPPAAGQPIKLDQNGNAHRNYRQARVDIENQHAYSVFVILTDPSGDKEYQGVHLPSGTNTSLAVNPGEYGFTLLVGETWCNTETGFTNGTVINYNNKFVATTSSVSKIGLLSLGGLPDDVMLSLNEGGLEDAGLGGTIELSRMADGHFYVVGSVNGVETTFLVDTGATFSKIPYSLAREIDLLKRCVPAKFQTAAGPTNGCRAIVEQFSFGKFKLRNLEVTFTPGVEVALMGMNVISQFRVQQNMESMIISNE